MEYTKVQTALNHVKDAITTKLDSIKSDVTNVNNSVTNLPTTLDSKFSALTTKVDGAKTEIKNSVSTLESSTYGYVPSALRGVAIDNITHTNWVDVVNVQGSGRLWMITPSMDWNTTEYEWKVTIDGKTTNFKDAKQSNDNKPFSFMIDQSLIASISDQDVLSYLNVCSQKHNSAGAVRIPLTYDSYSMIDISEVRIVSRELGDDCINRPTLLISKNGVLFNKNLRVQIRKINASYLTFGVCYSLN